MVNFSISEEDVLGTFTACPGVLNDLKVTSSSLGFSILYINDTVSDPSYTPVSKSKSILQKFSLHDVPRRGVYFSV